MKVWTLLIQQTSYTKRYLLGVYDSEDKAKKALEKEFEESDLYYTEENFFLSHIREQEVE